MTKVTPILVPLYYSNHLINEFMRCCLLETKETMKIYFLVNEDFDEETFNRHELEETLKYYNSDYVKIIYSNDNYLYSKSINYLYNLAKQDVDSDEYFTKFVIMNPDCFPNEVDWLSRMYGIWDGINDKNLCSLGSLQLTSYNNVWHYGCFWKAENEPKRDELDWNHNMSFDNTTYYIECDGNTGTGVMIDSLLFDYNRLDEVKHPHYCSDADWCMRMSKQGYKHYCSDVHMIHNPGNSTKK